MTKIICQKSEPLPHGRKLSRIKELAEHEEKRVKDMSGPKKILTFVPNGASSDNRVMREAESLSAAGHDVMVVGIRLPSLPGKEAISPGGVRINRIDWRYRAFSKIALVYATLLLPALFFAAIALFYVGWFIYSGFMVPILDNIFNPLGEKVVLGISWLLSWFGRGDSDQISRDIFVVGYDGVAFYLRHAFFAFSFYLMYLILRRPLRKLFNASRGAFSKILNNSLYSIVLRKFRNARNYGEIESVGQYTLLENILAPKKGGLWNWGERVTQYFVSEARTRGFIEVGRKFRPDIIHCHEIGSLLAAVSLKKELDCKVIYDAHEIYDDLSNASAYMGKVHKALHTKCLPEIDAFITVNEKIGEYYKHEYLSVPDPIIMPNSVYPRSVKYDGRLHEAAKLPSDAKILLYQGGFSPLRGLSILLEAAFKLPEDWYVVFMGRGALEEQLRQSSEEFMSELISKVRRDLTLKNRAENAELDRMFASLPDRLSETGSSDSSNGPVFRGPLDEVAIGQAILKSETGGLSSDAIKDIVNAVRNAEIDLAAARLTRQKVDELIYSGVLLKARFVPMAPHAELVEWTSGATVGIIPYENVGLNHWNCSPNKLWEYPNAGVPILASRLNFMSQVINKWGIGWTFASDPTVSEIVAAVKAISDAELEEKRAACRRFIEADNYTLHEQRLLTLVDGLFA